MEKLAEIMMLSGYPEDFRRGVLESAVVCYKWQVAAGGEVVPLYRPRDWPGARRRKKLLAKTAWFRPANTVIQVPCTPRVALATAVRQVVEEESRRLGLKVKVQEGAGVALRRSVVTGDMGADQPCPQGDCPVCLTGDGKGDRATKGVVLSTGGTVYVGMRWQDTGGSQETLANAIPPNMWQR